MRAPRRFARVAATLSLSLLPACESADSWHVRHYTPRSLTIPGQSYTLPTRRWSELFIVDATVNGRGPYACVVDTGVYETFFSPALASTLLQDEAGVRVVGQLAAGDLTVRDLKGVSIDLSGVSRGIGERIDAVLGLSAFRGYLLTFDYPRGEVRVSKGRLAAGPETARFTWDYESRPTIPFTLDEVSTMVMVDTGAAAPLILPSLDGIELLGEAQASAPVTTLSGPFASQRARAANAARIGPIEISQPRVITSAQGIPIVGAGLFGDYALTFDQERRLIRFERTAQ